MGFLRMNLKVLETFKLYLEARGAKPDPTYVDGKLC